MTHYIKILLKLVNTKFNQDYTPYVFFYICNIIYIKCVPPVTPQKKNAVSATNHPKKNVAKKDAVSISIGAVAFPCL
jgi:hypothetical protein